MPSWKKVIVSGSDALLNSVYSRTFVSASSANITTSFTASGLNYPTQDNGEFSFIQTDGNGNLSLQYVNTMYETIYNAELTTIAKGTPVYVSGSQGANSKVYRADASNPLKMPVTYIAADNIASGDTGRGILLGLITGVDTTGYPPGTEIYVAAGGGWTSTRPTGSNIAQLLGIVTKEGTGGQGLVLNPGPYNVPNLLSGQIFWGNATNAPIKKSLAHILSGSNYIYSGSFSGSFQGNGANIKNVSYNNIVNKPTLVSGSSQIVYNQISSIPSGIISGSGQISALGFTTCTGTVTSVGGTGTVAGISLSGTVTTTGNLTLGGTLSTPVSTINDSTTVGQNLVKLTNPSAIRFIRINADNTVSALSNTDFNTATGATTCTGTVTSIATNNGVTGGTITTTGTIGLTGQALALHNLATNGVIARTGAGTVAGRTITGTANQVTVTNGDGVSGNPTLSLPSSINVNASTATTLQNTRTINGVSFNGSANITITGLLKYCLLTVNAFSCCTYNPGVTAYTFTTTSTSGICLTPLRPFSELTIGGPAVRSTSGGNVMQVCDVSSTSITLCNACAVSQCAAIIFVT